MKRRLALILLAAAIPTACKSSPRNPIFEIRLDAAKTYYDAGDLARAASMARQALELEPNDPVSMTVLGMSLVRIAASTRDANEVVRALDEAIAIFEKAETLSSEENFQNCFGHGTACAQRARMYLLRAERNEKRVQDAIGPNPKPVMDMLATPEQIAKELERIQSEAKLDRGRAANDLTTGARRLESAITLRPKDLATLQSLQSLYALAEKFPESAKWGEEMVSSLAAQRDAYGNLAHRPGLRTDQLDTIRSTILGLDNQEMTTRSLLALAYVKMERYPEAVLDLSRVLSLDPDRVEDYFNRGFARQACNDYASAVLDYETFLRRSTLPTDSKMVRDTWDRLGVCRKALAEKK